MAKIKISKIKTGQTVRLPGEGVWISVDRVEFGPYVTLHYSDEGRMAQTYMAARTQTVSILETEILEFLDKAKQEEDREAIESISGIGEATANKILALPELTWENLVAEIPQQIDDLKNHFLSR